MSNKSLLKFIAAFGILAVILVFLGVNYVPSIFASSSSKNSSVNAVSQVRSDYSNELYPRSIKPQLPSIVSDFLDHHPYDINQKLSYTAADFLDHHPYAVSEKLSYTAANFLDHHPFSTTQQLKFGGSDWIERHPANYYSNSDWIERHPSNDVSYRSLIEAKSEK
jgi:hypothetical protein